MGKKKLSGHCFIPQNVANESHAAHMLLIFLTGSAKGMKTEKLISFHGKVGLQHDSIPLSTPLMH